MNQLTLILCGSSMTMIADSTYSRAFSNRNAETDGRFCALSALLIMNAHSLFMSLGDSADDVLLPF